MTRPIGYIMVTRQPWETDWGTSQLFTENGEAILNHLRDVALDHGAQLKSDTPELGWVLDVGGKQFPCGEHTDGARPTWVWWGV